MAHPKYDSSPLCVHFLSAPTWLFDLYVIYYADTGQFDGVVGMDANVIPAWKTGALGEDVTVCIVGAIPARTQTQMT